MALHAIVTAGGRLPRPLSRHADSSVKALLSVGGKTLLARAVEAAAGCPAVARIAVVGPAEVERALPAGAEYVRAGAGVMDNINNSFTHLGGDAHDYVVISPDLPFITAAALGAFIAAAEQMCDIGFPLISRDAFLRAYPQAPNFFERLDGRPCTMGSCIFARGPAVRMNIPFGRDLYSARKYPWRLAAMLGLPIIWNYLTGQLKAKLVEDRLSRLMDCSVRGVRLDVPGLAYDVDNRQNYEFALAVLRERGEAAVLDAR